MNILGIAAGFHDAAVTLINDQGDILFASSSERYSGIKNDPKLARDMLAEIDLSEVHNVAYYENPLQKQLRQLYAGQCVELNKLTTRQVLRSVGYPAKTGLFGTRCNVKSYPHHMSHAAAGFQTSPYDDATVLVVDAIGEWNTATIWDARYDSEGKAVYKKLWSQSYPHSIGLFYSAFTKHINLKPLDETPKNMN